MGTAKMTRESRASVRRDAGKRSRFMVILLLKFVCSVARGTLPDNAARSPQKIHSALLFESRSRCDLFVSCPLRCSEVAQSRLSPAIRKQGRPRRAAPTVRFDEAY